MRIKASLLALGWIGLATAYTQELTEATVARAMQQAAEKFLASLDDAGRKRALLPFDAPERLDWHNIPKPTRKGIQLRDMTPEQNAACHELLRAGLSESGYDKAVKIMALENNLREGEKNFVGGHLRDPLRYFLTIFGTPGSSTPWGWSFEGHHFSLNFTLINEKVVGLTPSFWGANPATVKIFVEGGPAVGTRTLADEEQWALDLAASLTPEQQSRAIVTPKAPDDYRAAGLPEPPSFEPTGLSVSAMTPQQVKLVQALLETYTGHWASPLAEQIKSEITDHKLDSLFFAWGGPTKPGVGHYYRLQGPTFVLELVNVQSDPAGTPANHIHSVWRNPRGDFGTPHLQRPSSLK